MHMKRIPEGFLVCDAVRTPFFFVLYPPPPGGQCSTDGWTLVFLLLLSYSPLLLLADYWGAIRHGRSTFSLTAKESSSTCSAQLPYRSFSSVATRGLVQVRLLSFFFLFAFLNVERWEAIHHLWQNEGIGNHKLDDLLLFFFFFRTLSGSIYLFPIIDGLLSLIAVCVCVCVCHCNLKTKKW